jgi:hypothetical protein
MLFLTASIVNVSESSMFETALNIERCATKNLPKMIFTHSSESRCPRGILNSPEARRAIIATGHSKGRTNARHRGTELRYCLLWYYTTPERHQANKPAQKLIIISSSRIPSSHIADNLPLSQKNIFTFRRTRMRFRS